ncbi:homoserine O-acetyltransferase MetX [Paludifilum halophilum]|uniref:Homoserine O-acetyltransferase n=1 Tax=Paludifilum halophilum TaxID=1642702 RepID=A0A235B8F7_9BACL|nr:homoserine O-acetyltransferase [Paludifilum halophilum]OYD08598.1 homoserine O-acetyltransferase [Paludifilum halophilum]
MPLTVRTSQKQVVPIGSYTPESGQRIETVEVAVETVGTLTPEKDNAVLVCHALTGDSHAVGKEGDSGWWDGLIGPGGYIDTNRYFVITMNVLGGCDGTTGPSSVNPATGQPYGSQFPFITIRDMVHVQRLCLDRLGVSSLHAVIGGSMGGMMVLEWGVLYPDRVGKLIPIATAAALSPTAIAYNDVGRQAILSDPDFCEGDYYPGPGPVKGLSIARMMGMITYRTAELFEKRFSRNLQDYGGSQRSSESVFQIESYLRYQGRKLVNRFDANTYLRLLKAMDTHDIGRGRGGKEKALRLIQSPVLVIGIREDMLFPIQQQRELHDGLFRMNKSSRLVEISSEYGHDAFLVDFKQTGREIESFLSKDLL